MLTPGSKKFNHSVAPQEGFISITAVLELHTSPLLGLVFCLLLRRERLQFVVVSMLHNREITGLKEVVTETLLTVSILDGWKFDGHSA